MVSLDRLEANLSNIVATIIVPLAVDGMPTSRCLPEIERPCTPKTPSEHPSLLTNTCFHFPAPVCTSTPIPSTPGKTLSFSHEQCTFRARRKYYDSLLSGTGHMSRLRRKKCLMTSPNMKILSPTRTMKKCDLFSYTRGCSPSLRRNRTFTRSMKCPPAPDLESCSFQADPQLDHVTFQMNLSTPKANSYTIKICTDDTRTNPYIHSDDPDENKSHVVKCCSLFLPSVSSVLATLAYIVVVVAKKTVVPTKYQEFCTKLQRQFWHDICG